MKQNKKIRFGSVCSGIEAASVAWNPLGWEAAWLSEIEKFPCEVLKHHYPNTPNLGDMTLLANKIQLGEVEAPDVFCGGTPCQAFSVAGLRQSLDDSRGNLSLTFCEIANAIDNRRLIQQSNPTIIFWENVPGVLNTKDNAFGCFLAGLAGEIDALIPPGGRWTDAGFIDGPKRAVAWRTLDAQYFGLAQRRKRVFVVASARNDICPAEILFEFEGVRRDIAPSGKKREKTANGLENIVGALCARDYEGLSADDVSEGKAIVQKVYETHPADSRVKEMGETCQTVTSRWGTGGGNVPLVQNIIALAENTIGRQPMNGGNGNGFTENGPMYTLNATGVHGIAHAICFSPSHFTRGFGMAPSNKLTGTIKAVMNDNSPHVAFTLSTTQDQQIAVGTYNLTLSKESTQTLRGNGHIDHVGGIMQQMSVRRLTPMECERLQGFPDGYTDIRPKGKDTPDGPRYKALGNSWAVPVVAWIGKRINDAIA